MGIKFEWDPANADANFEKHTVRFEQAQGHAEGVWKDIAALDVPDGREDYGEDRFNRLGMFDGCVLVVTYTARFDNGDEVIRIISARPATPRERRQYHEADL